MTRIQKQIKAHPLVVERMPAVLHTIHIPGIAIVEELNKMDLSWLIVYFALKNNQLTILFPEDRMIELGKRFLKNELKYPGSYTKLIKNWRNYEAKFNKICQKIDLLDFGKISLTKLKKLYLEFSEWYKIVWTIPLTSNNISYYADNVWIPKIIKKYGKKGIRDFLALSTPTKLSFIKQEEKGLIKIAIEIYNNKKLRKKVLESKSKKVLMYIQKNPSLYNKLKEHANNYHWLKNTYGKAVKLDVNYFLDRIKELLSKDPKIKFNLLKKDISSLEKKRQIILKKFTKEELVLANIIAQATTLQDSRKKNNLIGDYYLFIFLKEISNRTKYSFGELCYASLKEIEKILSGKKVTNLKSRIKCCVELIEIGFDKIYGGNKAIRLFNILDNIDKVKSHVSEIKGVVASLGKIKGVVRVVPDVSKVKVFNKGDILVASMTRPEYTQLMKKASAIITDEGGITSHAAIVSRELGIPCVIGTKIATKVLKDGMLVEVNANHGVIKILKK